MGIRKLVWLVVAIVEQCTLRKVYYSSYVICTRAVCALHLVEYTCFLNLPQSDFCIAHGVFFFALPLYCSYSAVIVFVWVQYYMCSPRVYVTRIYSISSYTILYMRIYITLWSQTINRSHLSENQIKL